MALGLLTSALLLITVSLWQSENRCRRAEAERDAFQVVYQESQRECDLLRELSYAQEVKDEVMQERDALADRLNNIELNNIELNNIESGAVIPAGTRRTILKHNGVVAEEMQKRGEPLALVDLSERISTEGMVRYPYRCGPPHTSDPTQVPLKENQ